SREGCWPGVSGGQKVEQTLVAAWKDSNTRSNPPGRKIATQELDSGQIEPSKHQEFVMIGSVRVRTRPLKLAHLVEPGAGTQVRDAIRLSLSLWGGAYFPIIPLYRRTPATWTEGPIKSPSAKEVVL